jgi:two-component system nitrogen regulation response regulator GlnG
VPGRTRFTILLPVRERIAMNPVWIIDDDRSIRWVFEKALAREGIAHRTFGAAQERSTASRRDAAGRGERHPHAGRLGLEFMQQLKARCRPRP